jgi:hypothetical protein
VGPKGAWSYFPEVAWIPSENIDLSLASILPQVVTNKHNFCYLVSQVIGAKPKEVEVIKLELGAIMW